MDTCVKLSGITLNAEKTAVTGGVATPAKFGDHLKQALPLIKDTDVAIVGSDTTRTVSELAVTAGLLYLGERATPVARVRQAVGI